MTGFFTAGFAPAAGAGAGAGAGGGASAPSPYMRAKANEAWRTMQSLLQYSEFCVA